MVDLVWLIPALPLAGFLLILLWCVGIASLSATIGRWHGAVQLLFYVVS